MVANIELVKDKSVVAVIDFQHSTIYPTDALPGQRPEHVVAADPHGHFHKVHHRAGNPRGTYEDDNAEYWRELTEALAPARGDLAAGTRQGQGERVSPLGGLRRETPP